MREQAAQLRGAAPGAVRASWAAEWSKGLLLSLAVSLFLSIVGAFGTLGVPILPRTLVFLVLGLGCGLIVTAVIALTDRFGSLRALPFRRRLVIALAVAPLITVWLWAALGFAFMGSPKLKLLPEFLFYSLLMSAAMTLLSWAVFRRRAGPAQAPSTAQPKFLERLPVRLRGAEIYAVQAEDHYLRLHTSAGSDLILMRLSDAIAELSGIDGAQTHRSWWVAKAALADAKWGDGRAVLKLKDGTEAPVSRSYARALREAGWY